MATNELDPTALSDEELIQTYAKKQQKVERGFRFLKDPLFMASTVFLKSAERIMALAMIMTLSLLVYSALEHRIRESLKMHQKTFPNQKGQPIHHPTARWVFQFFRSCKFSCDGEGWQCGARASTSSNLLILLSDVRFVCPPHRSDHRKIYRRKKCGVKYKAR